MRRLSITTRVAAIMAIPLVVIIATAMLALRAADDRSGEAEDALRTVELQSDSGELAALVADERAASIAVAAGRDGISLADARAALDAALAAAGDDLAARGAAFAATRGALAELAAHRAMVDRGEDPATVASYYSALVDTYLAESERLDDLIDDEDLAAVKDRYMPLVQHRESVRRTAGLAALVRWVAAGATPQARFDLVQAIGGTGVHAAELRSVVDDLTERYEEALSTPAAAGFEAGAAEVVAGTMTDEAFAAWLAAADGLDGDLAAIERDAVEAIRVTASDAADDAAADRRLVLVLSAIAGLLAVAISVLVALSITRPLARLRDQATKAAEDLPKVVESVLATPPGQDIEVPQVEQVDPGGGGEIEQVAAALNAVQNTAVALAVEQAGTRRNVADTFVNLGRRNQNLIGRQLEYLTRLEQDETDPEALEHLFHLDHLATRARRNAESLLVLAGLEPPRTWDRPVSVADVLRGALGEVEHYERAVFGRVDDARLVGSAVAPVTHLLAELVENALNFSPPSERVGLVGRWVGSRYLIAVVDRGIGMTDQDLALANIRLAGEESFTVSPSKYLGHHVAGELARRLGAEIRLEAGRSGGVVAQVMLPGSLMVEHAPDDGPDAGPASSPSAVVAEALAVTLTEPGGAVPTAAPVAMRAPTGAPVAMPAPAADDDLAEVTPIGTPAPASGLARRKPGAKLGPTEVVTGPELDDAGSEDAPRTPEEVRSMLSSFSAGVQRGRERGDRDREGE